MRRSTARRPAAPGDPAARGAPSGGTVDDRLLEGPYDIRASSAVADIPKLVLKHDDAFLVADRLGDVPGIPDGAFGFYAEDTRFVQRLELRLEGRRPLLLNATIGGESWESAIDLTNADVVEHGRPRLPSRTLRISRRLTILDRQLYQVVAIESFARQAHEVTLSWDFGADFVDVFEVRGHRRLERGVALAPRLEPSAVELPYRGRDGVVRTTRLDFEPAPTHLDAATARFSLRLDPQGRTEIAVRVSAVVGLAPASRPLPWDEALARRSAVLGGLRRDWARVASDHESFNRWVERSQSDLHLLLTATDDGFVPYAGIPWYVAPFGRDALVTALQVLPFAPEIARGTLRFLARHQARADDPFTDQEPGKILHEYRRGELASCREIPFLPYYGSVDATPLFVMLLAEYVRWTGDVDLARDLWPAVESALAWMASHGSGHEPGYLRYARRSSRGLDNQGWKDSDDAVMHASGALAPRPIAVVEAQGYQYAALLGAAAVAEAMGLAERAPALRARAERLRARFEADFWMDGEGCYALALDGGGEPCRVVSSNPGHCLWTGIASGARAAAVTQRLMADDVFTGWGLRTLGAREALYNPMSYHDGSVWPHDTAIAALGMRRYGLVEPFLTLATALFEAVVHFPGSRMPELFCGFPRRPGHGPTRYPVACEPQAWSAGVVFQLIAGMLGLVPAAADNHLTLDRPRLPAWLQWLEVHDLMLGKSRLTLRATQGREGAAIELLAREGDVELVVRR